MTLLTIAIFVSMWRHWHVFKLQLGIIAVLRFWGDAPEIVDLAVGFIFVTLLRGIIDFSI